jgi:hypothetical protein
MRKLIASLISGVSILALTLIAVMLDPDTFLQTSWRIISASLGACAVVGIVLQGIWTKQDEDAEREERQRLYKLIRKSLKPREQAKSPGHGSDVGRFGEGGMSSERWNSSLPPARSLHFQQGVSGYAAFLADQLLDYLSRTPPTLKVFYPWEQKLFEALREASNVGVSSFSDSRLLRPVSRESVIAEAERLYALAFPESE